MAKQRSQKDKRYDEAVIAVLQRYGCAVQAFGVASTGSPRGMEATKRIAQEVARDVLFAALGRDPTFAEMAQIPPLYEPPAIEIPLSRIKKPDEGGGEEPSN